MPLAETNPFCCTHTFFKEEIYGPLTSHCRRCGEAGSQQYRCVDWVRPTTPLPEPSVREAFGDEGEGRTCSPRNTGLDPRFGVGFKLHPIWRQRTVTPHPTGLPKNPSYGSSSPYQASWVRQYTHKDPLAWVGRGRCVPSLTKQNPSRLPMLEGVGACPTSAEPLTPQQDISQTHSASSAPTTCSTPHLILPSPKRLDSGSRLIYFSANFPELCRTNYRRSAAAPPPPDTPLWQALGALHFSCYFF